MLSESVSAVKATDSLTTRGCACNISAVVFEPVNAIVSLAGQVVEQITDTAADQLQATFWKDA